MPKLQTHWLVLLEGHSVPIAVTSDQRELAKREAADLPDGAHTSARFTAWAAMTRQGMYGQPWKQFNETDCIEVVNDPSVPVPDPEDEQGLDPGNRPTNGGD